MRRRFGHPVGKTVGARRGRGVTLVELIVAVSVLGILLALAAPAFGDMVLKQRLRGIHAQLVTDLQFARSQAAATGREVNVRIRGPGSTGTMSCYILFHDISRNYGQFGASSGCDCRQPPGSRCPAGTNFVEIRTVQIPVEGRVIVEPTDPFRQAVAFNPRTGGMVLQANEAGVATGTDFGALARIDTARALSAIVGLSGRTRICKPTGSQLPEEAC